MCSMSSAFERRNAVSLAYIAQLMVHSLPYVRREFKDGLGHQVSDIRAGRKPLRPHSLGKPPLTTKPFLMRTYRKRPSDQDGRPESRSGDEGPFRRALLRNVDAASAHKCFVLRTYKRSTCNPCRMNTYVTKDLEFPRMNTYKKTGGWGGPPKLSLRSFAPSKTSTSLFSFYCALFRRNTGVGGEIPVHAGHGKRRRGRSYFQGWSQRWLLDIERGVTAICPPLQPQGESPVREDAQAGFGSTLGHIRRLLPTGTA